jgi:NAD(P) transhydrogenase subunit alpha
MEDTSADAVEAAPSIVVGVPRETAEGEHRVALVPETVTRLASSGIAVVVEAGAGDDAGFEDAEYRDAGASIAPDAASLYQQADIVARVQPPAEAEVENIRRGSVVICFLDPSRQADLLRRLADRDLRVFSFNTMPRITRAQSMDAMSSMSTIAGYKAVLLAATAIGRFFPMLMTAAGTVPPARVLVLGAGVAGLQALATARRLGAVTEGFDTRPAVREQVQSVGADFIEMPPMEEQTEGAGGYAAEVGDAFLMLERDTLRVPVAHADVVITTALVPGKRAPVLLDEGMVASMRKGSVIVDLAGEAGGNTAYSVPGETVEREGVIIITPLNLPATLPTHASEMYARNVTALINLLVKDGQVNLDPSDEIIRGACLTLPKEEPVAAEV